MKVILLQDIKGTGKKGDIINASDGHARNYMLPRKLAVEATQKNLTDLESEKRLKARSDAEELAAAEELCKKIEEGQITLKVKLGKDGKLFGSVTTQEISTALKEQKGISIDKKKITLLDQIKSVGEKEAECKIHPKVVAKIKILVSEA